MEGLLERRRPLKDFQHQDYDCLHWIQINRWGEKKKKKKEKEGVEI